MVDELLMKRMKVFDHQIECIGTTGYRPLRKDQQVSTATQLEDGHGRALEYRAHSQGQHEPGTFSHPITFEHNVPNPDRRSGVCCVHYT